MQQSHAKNCSSATLNFLFSCNVTYGSLYSLPVSCLYVGTIKWQSLQMVKKALGGEESGTVAGTKPRFRRFGTAGGLSIPRLHSSTNIHARHISGFL